MGQRPRNYCQLHQEKQEVGLAVQAQKGSRLRSLLQRIPGKPVPVQDSQAAQVRARVSVHRSKKLQNGPDVAGAVKRGAAFATGKIKGALATKGEVRTYGACGGLSGGVVGTGNLGVCFASSKNPSGDWKYGISFTAGVGGIGGGLAGDASYLQSNADDLGQLAGWGIDKSATAHIVGGVTAEHEGAINPDLSLVRNSRNEPVWATSFGGGVGVEGGIGGGLNHTWMFPLN